MCCKILCFELPLAASIQISPGKQQASTSKVLTPFTRRIKILQPALKKTSAKIVQVDKFLWKVALLTNHPFPTTRQRIQKISSQLQYEIPPCLQIQDHHGRPQWARYRQETGAGTLLIEACFFSCDDPKFAAIVVFRMLAGWSFLDVLLCCWKRVICQTCNFS